MWKRNCLCTEKVLVKKGKGHAPATSSYGGAQLLAIQLGKNFS